MLRSIAIHLVSFYRSFISPLKPPSCRFYPTCSQYALESLEAHGFLRGSMLAVRRILRCNPFAKGGYDPVPPPRRGLITRPAAGGRENRGDIWNRMA